MADPSTAPPLTPASIAEAHEKIKPYIHHTPLITSATISAIASHPNPSAFLSANPPPLTPPDKSTSSPSTPKFNLYFKCENQQKIGAFKARGAHHALIRLISIHGLEYIQKTGVVTHSSGNHAQALALAAHNFNIPSYIVMPTISTASKIAGTRKYTNNVIFSGSTSNEREAKVREVIEDTGAILVPPYDHPDIILGQGTAAYEMEAQYIALKRAESPDFSTSSNGTSSTTSSSNSTSTPTLDLVLTPLGGGGLLGGTATWFSHTTSPNQTLVIGTEPSFSGANDAQLGLAQSPPTRIPHVSSLTIADGLRTPVGVLNWDIVSDKSKVHAVYSATEAQIRDALKLMMERVKVFVEPSAVVPVAVVLFCREFREWVAECQREQGGRAWDVGIVLSGGNTTVEALAGLSAKGGEKEQEKEREMGVVGKDGERKAEDVAG